MMSWSKLGLLGSAICSICVAKHSHIKIAAAKEGGLSDRFEVSHLQARGLQLKLVQVFLRHGARTPLHTLPNPNSNPELEVIWDKDSLFAGGEHLMADFGVKNLDGGPPPISRLENIYRKRILPGGSFVGQLTTVGKEQMHELGKMYKTVYVDELKYLNPSFSPDHIYIRSTNMMRSLESAACFLAGMFGEDMKKHGEVTIYTDTSENEILYPNAFNCKRFGDFGRRFWHDQDILPGIKRFREQLQRIMGLADSFKLNIVEMRDNLRAMEAHNLPIVRSLEPLVSIIDKRATEVMKYYVSRSTSEGLEVLQLTTGPVVHMIRENMQQVNKMENFQKFHIYSCHDTTLMALLCGLGIFDEKWPPYAADLTFELYEDKDGQQYVRTLYNGKQRNIMKNKDVILPLDKFMDLTKEVALPVEDYRKACTMVDSPIPI
ncbi:lysophosphatidic acid phosphatase type 6-like [Glandiceps talaboti]